MSTETTIDPAGAPAAAAAIFNPPAAPASPVTVNVTTPAAAAANPAAPPAPTPVSPDNQTVTLSMADVRRLLAAETQLATMEAQRVAAEKAAEEAKAHRLAKEGEWQKGFEKLKSDKEAEIQAERNRAALLESQTKTWVLDGELSRALADANLVPGGAQQLAQLWGNRFTVKAEGNRFVCQTPDTFQSVGEFVKSQLAQPEYGHFLRAQTTQGGTANGPSSAAVSPTPPATEAPPEPKNLSEAIILEMARKKQVQGDGRMNMGLAMGLRATR